jgi:hypothetical protein
MTAQFPPEVNRMQDNWAFCSRCYALWWNGRPDNGKCPASVSADGGHRGPSWNFVLGGQDPNPHGMSP